MVKIIFDNDNGKCQELYDSGFFRGSEPGAAVFKPLGLRLSKVEENCRTLESLAPCSETTPPLKQKSDKLRRITGLQGNL